VSTSDSPELTPVREAHRFDERALERYLAKHLDAYDGNLEVLQYEGGQSNPTYFLRSGEQEFVLRKQPPGELLPSAHAVDREYRVMKALGETDVPVPKMYALCEDTSLLGTKFYVMEHVVGRVYTDPLMGSATPAQRRGVYEDLADVLAKLHSVVPEAVGLDTFGRPGNYYMRQISRWSKQYIASQTEQIAEMDQLIAWLPENIPPTDETCVVHGDYRLGNAIIHPTEPRIVAILDWELSTLGHPLADLGYMCQTYYADEDDQHGLNRPNLDELGVLSEEAFIMRYCEKMGLGEIENWAFYIVYNLFRSAAIIQGVYRRGVDGNASSDSAMGFAGYAQARAKVAWRLVEERLR
jgi:aminoglycoside phosphotransferase (APT) family kinase protein